MRHIMPPLVTCGALVTCIGIAFADSGTLNRAI
jgi:hypothetical protein